MACVFMQDSNLVLRKPEMFLHAGISKCLLNVSFKKLLKPTGKILSVICCIFSDFIVLVLFPSCNTEKLCMNNKVVPSIHLASSKTIHAREVGTLQACVFTWNYHNCAHCIRITRCICTHNYPICRQNCNKRAGKMDMQLLGWIEHCVQPYLALGRFGFRRWNRSQIFLNTTKLFSVQHMQHREQPGWLLLP